MQKKSLALILGGAAFGLCLGGILTSRAVAQQPYQPPPGNRYQYKCMTKLPDRIWTPEAQNMLNGEGAQGWRLMENRFIFPNGYSDVYCFERRY
jgi:hypothetical protein